MCISENQANLINILLYCKREIENFIFWQSDDKLTKAKCNELELVNKMNKAHLGGKIEELERTCVEIPESYLSYF